MALSYVHKQGSPTLTLYEMEFISEEQLRDMVVSDGKTLADHLALAIGIIGENMSLPRAARLVAPNGVQLVGYSHPSPPDATQLLGKFGAILALKSSGTLTDVARQLCIHVIALKMPLFSGQVHTRGDLYFRYENREDQHLGNLCCASSCNILSWYEPKTIGSLDDPKAPNSDEETLLVHQEFLTDPSKTVGEVLQEENIEVVDFIRFECGEHKNEE
ncbi:elongation factor Ts, mitochondrial-like [Macrobrachium rosenbergii]|uniref:elongation factor Ts, mitochondrial-like n=1 Tax=Macrobrachium rosenbergii TaxID=79674 RepID=UPI0034D404A3